MAPTSTAPIHQLTNQNSTTAHLFDQENQTMLVMFQCQFEQFKYHISAQQVFDKTFKSIPITNSRTTPPINTKNTTKESNHKMKWHLNSKQIPYIENLSD